MSKLRLSSNVLASLFALVALTAAGCGGSDEPGTATGGKGGATATGGKGGAGTGGKGTGGSGTGGVGTGGVGTGGSGTGGAGTGGAITTGGAGGVAGAGGTGGANVCGTETVACTVNAVRCTAGVPQKCLLDTDGCARWVNQTVCGTHQTCDNATGACKCNAEPRCGNPGTEGNFCPTAGGSSFSVCTKDANSCLFVSAENQACTAPQTCQATGVVAAGTACGCPAAGTTLNSGCATLAGTVASASDNAVLVCQMVGACKLWRIQVNCADQSLTAGTDATSNQPACVCKPAGSAPGAANTVYVDPDPPMATFMTNTPTGALQPPACRFRSLAAAGGAIPFVTVAANSAFTRIVAIHETSSNVHFAAEPSPLAIPALIEVTTADGPSFNSAHYTIELGTSGGAAPRVSLANGSTLSGFTLAYAPSLPATTAPLLGFGVGSATGTVTASAHHLALVGNGTGTGISVTANGTLTSDLVSISAVGTAINVDHPGTGATPAAFTGTSITGTAISGTGVVVADANSRATLGTSTFTVTGNQGIQVLGGQATLTTVAVNVSGAGGFGIQNNAGTITITGTSPFTLSGAGTVGLQLLGAGGVGTLTGTTFSLTNVTAASRGIDVLTATPMLTMTGGSVTLTNAAAGGAVGVDVQNAATVALTGTTVTTGVNTHGVRARDTATVTIGGASVITNSCSVTTPVTVGCDSINGVVGSTSGQGIWIPASATNVGVVVNVGGTTKISKYQRGIEVDQGSLGVTGTVQITGNTDDGIRSWGLIDTTTTTVSITGATITGNGDQGVSVNTNVPTTVQMSTINSNKGDGIQVQSSQATDQDGFRFLASTNTIRLNGGRGIYVSGDAGRSGVRIESNTIAANVLEGIRISELSADVANKTEASITDNTVNGNLTSASTAPAHILAGGVFFTGKDTAGAAGPGTVQIKLASFLGNKVFANGRHEIGFDVAQLAGAGAWNISSNSSAVDMATVCSATAKPNSVYCYDTVPGEDLGVAIPAGSGILVKAKGVHFQNALPGAGVDYSTGIMPQTVLSPEPTDGVFLSCSAVTGPCI